MPYQLKRESEKGGVCVCVCVHKRIIIDQFSTGRISQSQQDLEANTYWSYQERESVRVRVCHSHGMIPRSSFCPLVLCWSLSCRTKEEKNCEGKGMKTKIGLNRWGQVWSIFLFTGQNENFISWQPDWKTKFHPIKPELDLVSRTRLFFSR